MSWREELERDAARIAFDGYEVRPGDGVTLEGDWTEAWGYSSYTFENASFQFDVRVAHADGTHAHRYYANGDAQEFFAELMRAGAAR